jgi:hypothetical protein
LRKSTIVSLAVAGLMAFTAVALAVQDNTYTVSGGVVPTKVGTKKKPTPVKLTFGYTVGEKSQNRPALIDQYDIFFENGQVNSAFFPQCSAAKIDQDQGDANCPKGSLMGTGNVENKAGATADETADSLTCHLDLKVYNAPNQHAALYLKGGPNDPRGADKSCPLEVNKAIDARYVKRATGTSLVFNVDQTLLHPAPGFDNAVVLVDSVIRKATKKVKGKTRGYFESAGKCRNGKSGIKVTFHQVNGTSQSVTSSAKCT